MKVGAKRILNDPRVPKDHICSKCKNDNTVVGFKIENGYLSRMCNYCLTRLQNVPKATRREEIAKKINDYQKEIYE